MVNKALLLAGFLAILLRDSALPAGNLAELASAILIVHAMRSARLSALSWCLAPGALALYLNSFPLGVPPLSFSMGVCFSVTWLLIADRRACVLACVGFASLWPSAPILAGAGLLTLLALSCPAQRKYALVSSVATSALFASTLLF